MVGNNVLNLVANMALLDGVLLLPHKEGKSVGNNVLNSVANMALLDGVLLLPHKEGKSVGCCLAMFVSSSRRGLVVAVNLSIGGGRVLSLLRCCSFKFLYDSNPFCGCTARSTLSSRSCCLIVQLTLGWDVVWQ